jgi:hypothetical protein
MFQLGPELGLAKHAFIDGCSHPNNIYSPMQLESNPSKPAPAGEP